MSCPVCDRSIGRCHAITPKTSSENSTPDRLQFGLRFLQEGRNRVGALPIRMLGFKEEFRVLLVALGREAHVVKLNLVRSVGGRKFCQPNVVVPNLWVGRVGPDQLSVFPPCSSSARLHRQFRMLRHQRVVAEDRNARDRVQSLGVEEAGKLRQIADRITLLLRRQWQSGRNAHRAIGILNIEHYAVAAGLAPGANDLKSLGAACHRARQVDRAYLEVLRAQARTFPPSFPGTRGSRSRLPAWARAP